MKVNLKNNGQTFEKGFAENAFNSEKNKLWHRIKEVYEIFFGKALPFSKKAVLTF